MISKLAQKSALMLVKKGSIEQEEKELYEYGLFILISHLFFFLLTVVFGVILSCIIESIIFYIAFQSIRRYAGGYHAATELRCDIMSGLSIFLSLAVIRVSSVFNTEKALFVLSIFSSVAIIIFCPLDTPEKPLSKKEFHYFRKISLIILALIILTCAVSFIFGLSKVYLPCLLSLILEGLLISAGKIQRIVNNHK